MRKQFRAAFKILIHDSAAEPLRRNLQEEQQALEKVTGLARQHAASGAQQPV